MSKYLYLVLAIVTEVFGTTMMKYSEGFTIFLPSVGSIVGYLLSFTFLGLTLRGMSLSVAYSVWAGVGTALTAFVGFIIWDEPLGLLKVSAILLIIVGVVIANMSRKGCNPDADMSISVETK